MDVLRLAAAAESSGLYFVLQAISIIWIQATAFLLAQTRDSRAVFTNLSASAYIMVGNVAGIVFFTLTGSYAGAHLFACVIHMLLLVILVRYVREPFRNMLVRAGNKGFMKLCIIPVLFYATVMLLCFYPHPLYEHPINIIPASLLLLTMFVSYAMIFQVVESEVRHSELLWSGRMLESYTKGIDIQYKAVTRAEEDVKILRHDLRHYITSLSVLLQEGQYGEAQKMLGVLTDETEKSRLPYYCENRIVNSVLCGMIEQAEKENICVNADIVIPEEMEINSTGFAAVLANLLENAVLAVQELKKEEREINILAHYEEGRLILEITNRCPDRIFFDKQGGLPVTTRGGEHGLGLQSVAAFAEKNRASFDCYQQGNIFTARLFWNKAE